jgi:hypothetical protein
MLRLLAILPVALVVLVQGCSYAENQPTPLYFDAVIEGAPWSGEDVQAGLDSSGVFAVIATDSSALFPSYGQRMAFSVPVSGRGTYSLAYRLNTGPHGDEVNLYGLRFELMADTTRVEATYLATRDAANRLVITRYDRIEGYVEGTFAATLARESGPEAPVFPGTLRVTGGRFRVQIEDLRGR